MVVQIKDIEMDLNNVSLLQTEDGNTSDITINYSSVKMIIYDNDNL